MTNSSNAVKVTPHPHPFLPGHAPVFAFDAQFVFGQRRRLAPQIGGEAVALLARLRRGRLVVQLLPMHGLVQLGLSIWGQRGRDRWMDGRREGTRNINGYEATT